MRRIAGLSNGGYRQLNRMTPIEPAWSFTTVVRSACPFSVLSRSIVGFSHQSNSPARIAAALVGGIGHDIPFDAIEMHRLRARRHLGRPILARHILGELLVHHARSGNAFRCDEAIRAGAHHLAHLLHRIGQRQTLRHDAAHAGGGRERIGQQRERLLQPEPDLPVGRRRHLVGRRAQHAAEPVALPPALDAGHAVARQHRAAVMELQARRAA